MPNGSDDVEPWKVTQAKFQGYMKANIENIKEDICEIKRKNGKIHKDLYDKHEEHDRKITTLVSKMAIIATGLAIGISISIAIVTHWIKKLFGME